jgi:serine/threonine-protein kinase
MLVGKKIGPFTIDKELGAGAMGAVYRARHVETGQRVAIKVVAPGLATNPTAMKRFEREAAILKQLKHPNIVRLVLTGKFGGTPFYAMEYVEGVSLDRVMSRRDKISWAEVVDLGCQLCEALKHAHDKGIIHRDLKPSNVMVLEDGTLKLTDFGIAKDTDVTALTSANCTVGTAAYMSPEQCRGERDLTFKSDLYSLGVMFYELVTGRKPFQADNPMDMFMKHVNEKCERPSRLVLDIPVWLDNLICQLLEKKPEQRPRDAATVAEALSRIKEKVEAQRSAGVEAVTARGDRPRLDDEDREAARTLLGKKKKKKKGRQFYQQVWFKAGVYSALLVAIVAVFWMLFFTYPSADTLFAQARQAKDAETLDERVEARKNGAIAKFLRYYPEDERAKGVVRQWADEIDREKAEKDLVERFRKDQNTFDTDEERAREAIKQEEAGKFDEARKTWETLRKFKGAADADKHGYALVAEGRIKTLDWLKDEDARLSAHVNKGGPLPEFKVTNEYEAKAADALKEELNERTKGWAAWEKFKKGLDRDKREERPWFLLAVKHQDELPQPPAEKKEKKGKETSRRPSGVGAYAMLPAALSAPAARPVAPAARGSRPDPAAPSPPRTSSSPRRAGRSGRA